MNIEKIKYIRRYRIFHDFSWREELDVLKSKNLIYGWNGSGKSTLSGIFQKIEFGEDISDGEVSFQCDGLTIKGSEISTASALPKIRVFNREFVERNVFTNDGSVAPIVFLGERNIDLQQRYSSLSEELSREEEAIISSERRVASSQKDRDKFLTDNANNKIKPVLRSSGRGNPYNNYNRSGFERTLSQLAFLEDSQRARLVLNDDRFDQFKKTIAGNPREKVKIVEFPESQIQHLISESYELCERVITAKVLEKLKANPEIEAWVGTGLHLHNERDLKTCAFCDQKLPEDRLSILEGHFNTEFERLKNDGTSLVAQIESILLKRADNYIPSSSLLYDELQDEYNSKARIYSALLAQQLDVFRLGLSHIKEKLNSPFNPFVFEKTQLQPSGGARQELDDIIEIHNKRSNDFEVHVKDARLQLEKSMAAQCFDSFKSHSTAVKTANNALQAAKDKKVSLKTEIENIEKEILDHRRPADDLNADLCAYLGRDEITFKIADNGYQIFRGDDPAQHLSEGERTAIAFLYFLTSLRSKDFDLENGIVVIDDPVSSLDSSALFHAFGFMKEKTKDAKQLIILTHSHSFFRLIKNWYMNLPGQKKRDPSRRPANFLMLRAYHCPQTEKRQSKLDKLDVFLWKYDSEYHYLFKQVWCIANAPDSDEIESLYGLPNVARRLLEGFIAFRYPEYDGNNLHKTFEDIDFDLAKKTRILRFLNTYSHNALIDSPEGDFSGLAESKLVFSDLLLLIRHEDEKHHDKMIALCEA